MTFQSRGDLIIKPSYRENRRKSIEKVIEHQKLKSVLFKTFTRDKPETGYFFAGQDIDLDQSSNRGSWDLVLISSETHDTSPLIFIEIKSSFDSPSDLMIDIKNKISLTKKIIRESPDVIISQILQNNSLNQTLTLKNAEFVIFLPGSYSQQLLDYVTNYLTKSDEQINLIIWSYNLEGTEDKAILIPYCRRPKIKVCKNTTEKDCEICLCLHEDRKLMDFLIHTNSQKLEMPRIIPSARKYLDPAVNIISVLSYGEVFRKEDLNITEPDIKARITSFLSDFYITSPDDEADHLFGNMKKAKIIRQNVRLPIPSFHLIGRVKRKASNEKELMDEVSKRAAKYLPPTRTLDQFG